MVNDPLVETQTYEAQAQLLKVLTHPARLAILNILRMVNTVSAIWKPTWAFDRRISHSS